jgi:hypothetical protein
MRGFTLSLYNASVLDRFDLFEERLARLAKEDYQYMPWCRRFLKFGTKSNKVKLSGIHMTSFKYENELTEGIFSTVRNNQVMYLQLLLDYISNTNITLNLLYCYELALTKADKTYARMIMEMVLSNQAAFAKNRLYRFLWAAVISNEMESASLILKKGIGIEFRKEVILNLNLLLHVVNLDTNENAVEAIGQWPLNELDYGLRLAARDGNLKSCKFLISKGASIRRADVGYIFLKRCVDMDDRDLLPYVSQYFDCYKIERTRSRKGKWTERVKFHVYLKFCCLLLKIGHKPNGY